MSKTYLQPGDTLDLVAPEGGVTSGVPLLVGGVLVVPQVTAAAGVTFAGMVVGVHAYTKTASQAWTQGQAIHWNTSTSKFDSDASTGPRVGFAVEAVDDAAGSTTGKVLLTPAATSSGVFHIRKRFSVAQVNAGADILPALAAVKYRLLDAAVIAIGGNASAAFNINGTATTERKLVAFASAQATRSALLRAGATGADVLADGASFTANDAGEAVTIKKDSGDIGTASHIDVLLAYAMDPA